MSEENRKKIGDFGDQLRKWLVSVGVIVLLFDMGMAWMENEVRTFESAKEKFEVIGQVEQNTEDIKKVSEIVTATNEQTTHIKLNQEEFRGDVKVIIKAIDNLDKKVQWNFNRINNNQ